MYAKGASISTVEQGRILDEAYSRARVAGPRGVAVFDLDSTLLDNRPRQALILSEFGRARGLAPLADCRPEHWTSWDIGDAMRAAGLDGPSVALHAAEAKAYWRAHFFTSAYCVHDIAIAGAAAFLAALRPTGVRIAYVTGRHTEMGAGSIDSFRAAGFPLPDGADIHLMLKPTFELGDDAWKEQAYARLDLLGEVVAAFDNEPTHINGYAGRYPRALCVHLATDESGRGVPVAAGIPAIADFTRR